MTLEQARLSDFQVTADVGGAAPFDEERRINMSLFASFEPVRLWLRERDVRAPFSKLVVGVRDERSRSRDGAVANALGVCEVSVVTEVNLLRERAGDHRWVLALVRRALSHVFGKLSWRSAELERLLDDLSAQSFPLVHFFSALTAVDEQTGTQCRTWFAVRPGHTEIGVRLEREGFSRDVIVASKDEPLYLEDDFDVVKARCRDGQLVLVGRGGDVLARVPVVERSTS